VLASGLIDFKWDYVAQVQAATTDTWTFRAGGAGTSSGTIVGVIVVTWTSSAKTIIDNVGRTT
jgi:hypothetical protein